MNFFNQQKIIKNNIFKDFYSVFLVRKAYNCSETIDTYFVVPMTFDVFGIDILTVKMRSTDYTRGARYSLLNRTVSRVPSRRISKKKKKKQR